MPFLKYFTWPRSVFISIRKVLNKMTCKNINKSTVFIKVYLVLFLYIFLHICMRILMFKLSWRHDISVWQYSTSCNINIQSHRHGVLTSTLVSISFGKRHSRTRNSGEFLKINMRISVSRHTSDVMCACSLRLWRLYGVYTAFIWGSTRSAVRLRGVQYDCTASMAFLRGSLGEGTSTIRRLRGVYRLCCFFQRNLILPLHLDDSSTLCTTECQRQRGADGLRYGN